MCLNTRKCGTTDPPATIVQDVNHTCASATKDNDLPVAATAATKGPANTRRTQQWKQAPPLPVKITRAVRWGTGVNYVASPFSVNRGRPKSSRAIHARRCKRRTSPQTAIAVSSTVLVIPTLALLHRRRENMPPPQC